MANPRLIDVTRGARVESFHRGALAVADATGNQVLRLGDTGAWVYPRSAIKAWQCLAFVESGAADEFSFGNKEIALASGSHTAARAHLDVVSGMLDRIGLETHALCCGAHVPLGGLEAQALFRSGDEATVLHNNCSGKHAAMLGVAKHIGAGIAGYWRVDHAVQVRVREALADVGGIELSPDDYGTDGCSLPNWAMPLENLASGMARFVTGRGLPSSHAEAALRICEACWAEPDMVAGARRLDTVVMKALPGEVFVKTGAEGVYCGGLPKLGLGFALKTDDGAKRAAEAVTMALIETLVPAAQGLYPSRSIRSWVGDDVGAVLVTEALRDGLRTL